VFLIPKPVSRFQGFTLAELLIALAILGVIATFTIPKVLTAQQNQQKIAASKEVIAMLSGVYQQYTSANGYSASTSMNAMTPYMNYASVLTTGQMDDTWTNNNVKDCSSGFTCLKLHNGGTLFFDNGVNFAGTGGSNGIRVYFDPDSVRLTTPESKSLLIILFYNGKISTWAQTGAFTDSKGMSGVGGDPVWFNW
jgi:prepilin-type N-terminal cleavage/methylation domain-containing protein